MTLLHVVHFSMHSRFSFNSWPSEFHFMWPSTLYQTSCFLLELAFVGELWTLEVLIPSLTVTNPHHPPCPHVFTVFPLCGLSGLYYTLWGCLCKLCPCGLYCGWEDLRDYEQLHGASACFKRGRGLLGNGCPWWGEKSPGAWWLVLWFHTYVYVQGQVTALHLLSDL